MDKKNEITKERLEQLEGFERIVQAMKENGFDTFKSVKEFLQDHKRLEAENELLKQGLKTATEDCAAVRKKLQEVIDAF